MDGSYGVLRTVNIRRGEFHEPPFPLERVRKFAFWVAQTNRLAAIEFKASVAFPSPIGAAYM